MTEIQKQFEEWAEKWGYNLKMITPLIGYESADKAIYANGQTRPAWLGWQASRAAVVVKLPDICELYPRLMLESEVEKSLDKAGVKYER